MGKKDKNIDAYIAKSAAFAQPVLIHLRELIHTCCPEVEEKMKWSFPHFDYKGMMCSMAAFKQHCAFGFWKASIMSDPKKLFVEGAEAAMGHLGRIMGLKDLPPDKVLMAYIKEAVKLNEEGVKLPARVKVSSKTELSVPDYFTKALNKNKKALKVFEAFSYSQKKEYTDWLTEAKTEETRNKRLATAVEWIAEGKIRNWKYLS
jgi:uncharacterized protein YdeI (YjbR/CyaY-like superfamily)